uniref:Secreted protein n=1 Tax=Mus spicilegus TaxID=10103 RepID=A0A8C6IGQ8_MUSSI
MCGLAICSFSALISAVSDSSLDSSTLYKSSADKAQSPHQNRLTTLSRFSAACSLTSPNHGCGRCCLVYWPASFFSWNVPLLLACLSFLPPYLLLFAYSSSLNFHSFLPNRI